MSQIIKPSDENILSKLVNQQEEDHKRNKSGGGDLKTMCRAIIITALLQDGKVEKENLRDKLERSAILPPDIAGELDDIWAQVENMVN